MRELLQHGLGFAALLTGAGLLRLPIDVWIHAGVALAGTALLTLAGWQSADEAIPVATGYLLVVVVVLLMLRLRERRAGGPGGTPGQFGRAGRTVAAPGPSVDQLSDRRIVGLAATVFVAGLAGRGLGDGAVVDVALTAVAVAAFLAGAALLDSRGRRTAVHG
jgi:hypothetical protein